MRKLSAKHFFKTKNGVNAVRSELCTSFSVELSRALRCGVRRPHRRGLRFEKVHVAPNSQSLHHDGLCSCSRRYIPRGHRMTSLSLLLFFFNQII